MIPALNPAGSVAHARAADARRRTIAACASSIGSSRRASRRARVSSPAGSPTRAWPAGADSAVRDRARSLSRSRVALSCKRFYLGSPEALLEDPGDPGKPPTCPSSSARVAYARAEPGQRPAPGRRLRPAGRRLFAHLRAGRAASSSASARSPRWAAMARCSASRWRCSSARATPLLGLAGLRRCRSSRRCLHGMVPAGWWWRRWCVAGIDGPGLPVLIATTGLMIVLSEYQRLTQGNELRWLPPVLNAPRAAAAQRRLRHHRHAHGPAGHRRVAPRGRRGAVAVMRLTGFGRQWRALADDPGAAALFGVDRNGASSRSPSRSPRAWPGSPASSSPPIMAASATATA